MRDLGIPRDVPDVVVLVEIVVNGRPERDECDEGKEREGQEASARLGAHVRSISRESERHASRGRRPVGLAKRMVHSEANAVRLNAVCSTVLGVGLVSGPAFGAPSWPNPRAAVDGEQVSDLEHLRFSGGWEIVVVQWLEREVGELTSRLDLLYPGQRNPS